jgi:hypothetical protein
MNARTVPFKPGQLGALLRAEPSQVSGWVDGMDAKSLLSHLLIIVAGAGCYGAAMGWWRAPEQGLYTAIKFPLIILLTTFGNALLNGMLAPLLGFNAPFRQSLLMILMSFSIASAILGAFSPLAAFLIWSAPSIADAPRQGGIYAVIMLTHVVVIAFAGIAANLRLRNLLLARAGRVIATRVLLAWLTVNLFVGSQLSWIFRPFFGAPGLELQFLRDEPLKGNFYQAVYRSALHLFKSH